MSPWATLNQHSQLQVKTEIQQSCHDLSFTQSPAPKSSQSVEYHAPRLSPAHHTYQPSNNHVWCLPDKTDQSLCMLARISVDLKRAHEQRREEPHSQPLPSDLSNRDGKGNVSRAFAGCDRPCRPEEHQRTKTGERLFECLWPSCGKKYPRRDQLAKHTQKHTGEKKKNNKRAHPCTFSDSDDSYHRLCRCRRKDIGKRHLRSDKSARHTVEKKQKKKRDHLCTFAGYEKSYHGSCHLKAHQRKHTSERYLSSDEVARHFVCPLCQKRFRGLDGLRKHALRHPDDGSSLLPRVTSESYKSRRYLTQEAKVKAKDPGQRRQSFILPGVTSDRYEEATVQLAEDTPHKTVEGKELKVIDQSSCEENAKNLVQAINGLFEQIKLPILLPMFTHSTLCHDGNCNVVCLMLRRVRDHVVEHKHTCSMLQIYQHLFSWLPGEGNSLIAAKQKSSMCIRF